MSLNKTVALSVLAFSYGLTAEAFDLGPIPEVHIECFEVSPDAQTLSPDPTFDGSWLQFRRDRKQTGRSPLIGTIGCPDVLWTYDYGARINWVALTPGTESGELSLPVEGETGLYYYVRDDYEIIGTLIDLDGDRSNWENADDGHKIRDFFPDLEGLERFSCEMASQTCSLQNRFNKAWNTVWVSEEMPGFAGAFNLGSPIIGDFDNDGEKEAAVIPWYDLHMLDLATGAIEQTANFHDSEISGGGGIPGQTTGRAYGWFGAFNVDNEPKHEFIILGDFEMFVSVIDWENGELKELWDHQFEAGTRLNQVLHDTGVNPVADVDGDMEIVTSVFNERGDGLWHVLVFDGLTGSIQFDLVNRHLAVLGDVNGDGADDLLLEITNGQVINPYGTIQILSLADGEQTEIWQMDSGGFEFYDISRFADNVNSGASSTYRFKRTAFLRDDWTNGLPVFITREAGSDGEEISLRLHQWQGQAVAEIGEVTGPRLDVLSFPEEQGILIQSTVESTDESSLTYSDVSPIIEYSGRLLRDDGPASADGLVRGISVAPLTVGSSPTVILQDYGLNIRALEVEENGSILEKWRKPGRAGIIPDISGPSPFRQVVISKPGEGGHSFQLIVADSGGVGQAVIRALDEHGATRWETEFDVPGAPPFETQGGITHWRVGHFTTHDHEDVLVTVRPSRRDSDEIHLLNGLTGQRIWSRTEGVTYYLDPVPHLSGPGADFMPVFDWDGDGLDEVLDTNWAFAIYDGEDGSTLLNRLTLGCFFCERRPPEQIFTGLDDENIRPAQTFIVDALGNGSEQIVFGANTARLALLEFNGDPIWTTPFTPIHLTSLPSFTLQGVGDLNGDGKLELLSVGHCRDTDREIKSFDAATGSINWELSFPECSTEWAFRPTHVATVDLDGDGKEEGLFTQKNVLYAVGENDSGQGRFLWKVTIGEEYGECLGDVTVADVYGNGTPQILVSTASGHLFALGDSDYDKDDLENVSDTDDDNDRVPDGLDQFPLDPDQSQFAQPFDDAASLGDGWAFGWLGIFNGKFMPWIFHSEHSWMYIWEESTTDSLFAFDLSSNHWYFTSASLYPNLYSFGRGSWVFYFEGTSVPREFVDLQSGEFFNME